MSSTVHNKELSDNTKNDTASVISPKRWSPTTTWMLSICNPKAQHPMQSELPYRKSYQMPTRLSEIHTQHSWTKDGR